MSGQNLKRPSSFKNGQRPLQDIDPTSAMHRNLFALFAIVFWLSVLSAVYIAIGNSRNGEKNNDRTSNAISQPAANCKSFINKDDCDKALNCQWAREETCQDDEVSKAITTSVDESSPSPILAKDPSTSPTVTPTSIPSTEPSVSPTTQPSASPTDGPTTHSPTLQPTALPTTGPTATPYHPGDLTVVRQE